MTREDFEQVFTKVKAKAMSTVRWKLQMGYQDAADAVQNAAVYCLENLDRFEKITESYFIQLAVSRAKNYRRDVSRRWEREQPAGLQYDLAIIEEQEFEKREGRKPALPRAE